MSQRKRAQWKDADNTLLISLWGQVNSVALIAIMMKRTLSSVQTHASRLGLPPREEQRDRHRRRWTDEDDAQLDKLLAKHTRKDGMIPIQTIADELGRSVDAIVARLIKRHGEDSDVLGRLVAPPLPQISANTSKCNEIKKEVKTNKAQGKERKCLRCRKSFYSSGNWNWICSPCKRSEDWQNDWP